MSVAGICRAAVSTGEKPSIRRWRGKSVKRSGLEVVGTARLMGLYARFRHGASDHVSVFVVDEWSGTPEIDGLEIAEYRFFAPDDIPAIHRPRRNGGWPSFCQGRMWRSSGERREGKNAPAGWSGGRRASLRGFGSRNRRECTAG